MTQVAVFLGNRQMNRKSLYVACLRATSLQGLFLIGKFIPPTKINTNDKTFLEMTRLRDECIMVPKFQHLREVPNGMIQIISFNVQSLKRHANTLKCDQVFTSSDLLALQETWLSSTDTIEISPFEEVVRNKQSGGSCAKGTIILGKGIGSEG